MRPRTLRELTDLAREEMAPTEEERSRVYDSLRLAVAAGAAGAGLAAATTASAAVSTSAGGSATAAASTAVASTAVASTTAASTAAASTATSTAASSTAAAVSGATQGGALAAGAVQAGGALTLSSGLLLKGLVLLVAVGGGARLMSVGGEEDAADRAHSARTEAATELRRETTERIDVPPEAPLAAQELGVQEEASGSSRSRRRRQAQRVPEAQAFPEARTFPEARPRANGREERSDDGSQPSEVGAELTRAARRLQAAQRAMARGDGAAALALLSEDGDPRLQAERLALRVLALCQVGDEERARGEANELRALDDPSSAALARISSSCAAR